MKLQLKILALLLLTVIEKQRNWKLKPSKLKLLSILYPVNDLIMSLSLSKIHTHNNNLILNKLTKA